MKKTGSIRLTSWLRSQNGFRILTNACLLVALSSAVIPSVSDKFHWTSFVMASASALIAVLALFLTIGNVGEVESAVQCESVVSSAHEEKKENAVSPEADFLPVKAEFAPSWEVGEHVSGGWLVARYVGKKDELISSTYSSEKNRIIEKVSETLRLQRISEARMPVEERAVVVTIGKIVIRIEGDDAEVHVATAGKSRDENERAIRPIDDLGGPVAVRRVIN